jgi:hypothetical protein
VASIQFYREGKYGVEVQQLQERHGMGNPLYDVVHDHVAANAKPWRGLSDAIAEEVEVRRYNLKCKLNSPLWANM